jgi:hypothetical protein
LNTATWGQIWCYYRNLVHTTYREIRHIGAESDNYAKCHISSKYLEAAGKCRNNRDLLKSTIPFRKVTGTRTDEVIDCYRSLTGLALNDLVDIFRTQKWASGYGGEKWAAIAEVAIQLKSEIDRQSLEGARTIVERVNDLHHNTRSLVPNAEEWKRDRWLQEKWPVLCGLER